MIWQIFPGLDLHYADTAQPLTTAGELDDLYGDLVAVKIDNYVHTESMEWRISSGHNGIAHHDVLRYSSRHYL